MEQSMNYLIWIPTIINTLISGGALIWVAFINRNIGKKLFIHELQFQKEFEAYERLWELLIEFRNKVGSQRPMMGGPLATDEEAMRKLTKEAWGSYNKVITEYWKMKPFYSTKVFETINEVLKIGAKETIQYESMVLYGRERDDYSKAQVHLEEIANHLDKIVEAIRERIQFPEKI